MQIIDAQIHLWNNNKAPRHHRQAPFRINEALREMDAAGVSRAINCPPVWDLGANAYAVEAARLHPDRFATLGWFDFRQPVDGSFLEQFINQPGMLGLRFLLFTPEQQAAFSSGRLDWIWQAADRLALPVALMLPPTLYSALDAVAHRYPRMRLLVDHLGAPPFAKVPQSVAHIDALLSLAVHPNIAVKATGVPSMVSDGFPFESVHPALRRVFDEFGPKRTFWGSDITRLECSWQECIDFFTNALPWLKGDDLEWVMGLGVRAWINWD